MTVFETHESVCQWLNQFHHPLLVEDWAYTQGIAKLLKNGSVRVELPFTSASLDNALRAWIEKQDIDHSLVHITTNVRAMETEVSSELVQVKNVIAVTSGKGGVGKSTTAVNLALALQAQGARVGLLDADIYGPSVPTMLSTEDESPDVKDGKYMVPVEMYGIHTNSIGYLVDKSEAAIWRGPMASKALGQLLNETAWPELDYLVIDMPPGTGDVQLTLSQQIPVTGALIVTTPQDLALADVRKGMAMFNKVNVPVLGIVENMSYHICSHCGEKEHIFGVNGAEKMAKEFGTSLLAQLPLHISMREDIDAGKPTVAARPDSEYTGLYLDLAERITSKMYWSGKVKPETIPLTSL
ncbi:iron-sulfur cluster carrier protein ApbC [Vibrio albus]|uniref:Iron-sulfur cluster carrier protein n=1 Tax=Vibrio albus TaxID=2200953 RepID=A0A2U3BDY6_9VIBR|nr:iron-sulfur cluster carrier protein ApbC [Vibrio albus]PWI35016.1 iron-sulfur cluster carrier protein ApbC [Vibrio albus]